MRQAAYNINGTKVLSIIQPEFRELSTDFSAIEPAPKPKPTDITMKLRSGSLLSRISAQLTRTPLRAHTSYPLVCLPASLSRTSIAQPTLENIPALLIHFLVSFHVL